MSAPYAWTASFVQPAVLTNLVVTPDTDSISLDATVAISADLYHYEYLWESAAGDGDWTEIGRTTDPVLTYYLTPLNQDVQIRVSDSNGSQYSDTIEATGLLTFLRWAMTHVDGNDDFIQELRYVQPNETTDMPLDLTVVQPLSGPVGDRQPPIVFRGQWQGERIGFQVDIKEDDRFLIDVFRRAAFEPQGKVALKDPKGNVYIVQLGSLQKVDLGAGRQRIAFTAIRVT